MSELTVTVTNGDGEIAVSPLVEAMIRVIVKAQDRIGENREGSVELHYVSATGKVHGKLKSHVGLERIVD